MYHRNKLIFFSLGGKGERRKVVSNVGREKLVRGESTKREDGGVRQRTYK